MHGRTSAWTQNDIQIRGTPSNVASMPKIERFIRHPPMKLFHAPGGPAFASIRTCTRLRRASVLRLAHRQIDYLREDRTPAIARMRIAVPNRDSRDQDHISVQEIFNHAAFRAAIDIHYLERRWIK